MFELNPQQKQDFERDGFLVVHGMRSDAAYNPEDLSAGTGPIYGCYKRLGDNVLDENYFPITWREDGYRTLSIDDFLSNVR